MILDIAREQVLERGIGLDEAQTLEVLQLPDERVDDALALAHEVRMRWCGPEVEVEGIVSIKTGGCPEDCHFCSQSGRFETPVRAVRLDIPSLVEAARETARHRRDRVLHRRRRARPGRAADGAGARGRRRRSPTTSRSTSPARSASSPASRARSCAELGVHRYNHNLETARSHFGNVVTTHTWEERWETLQLVRELGMEVCCGGIIGMGETLEQRAELAAQFAALDPDEVPLNFLDPRPGTPFADLEPVPAHGRAAHDRRVPARAAAHDPALRRRARADAGRPRRAPGHGRRHQRGDRRQLPDDARPRPAGGPRPAGRALDAGQGAVARRCEHGAERRRSRRTAPAAASRSRGRPRALPAAARPAALLHAAAAASSRSRSSRPATRRECVRCPADRRRALHRVAARRSRARRGRR